MKILFIAGREPAYVRNAVILTSLAKCGIEIINCTDSSASYPARYLKVILKFLSCQKYDAVFIGFLGQPLVPIIRMFTRKPIIFDAFLSTYDTICFDRKMFKPDSLFGRFFYNLDKYSCKLADKVVLDTDAHIDYFTKTFALPKDKFHRVFVGAEESLFYPRDLDREDKKFRIFYYSSFLPLHGTEYIVLAANILREHADVEFVIVGRGLEHKKIQNLVQSLNIDMIRFIDWLPYEQLPLVIAQADICLGGHFSDIDKAGRVIAGKTFQFLAMKKPVIVGDCPGNRELLTNRRDALFVSMADPGALANAIIELRDNVSLREDIALGGYETFMQQVSNEAIKTEIQKIVNSSVQCSYRIT